MGRRPRILVMTTSFPLRRRGDVTANFVVDPVVGMARRGHVRQRVLAPLDADLAARRECFMGLVDVRRFRSWLPRSATAVPYGDGIPSNVRGSWAARLQLPVFALAMLLAAVRHVRWADVVHAHWLPTAFVALPLCRLLGRPLVVTLHGTDVTQLPERVTAPVLRRVDRIVTAHDDLAALAGRLAPETPVVRLRHHVAPQPREHRLEPDLAAWRRDRPMGLFVARLSPERDPVTFVRAAAVARAAVPDACFALVGDGPLRDEVAAEATRLGLDDDVLLRTGHRADVWTFQRQASAFVACSDRNNIWVTALVEAMRAGTPAVVTRAGDSATALEDGTDALLTDIADHRAIGMSMASLLTDQPLAARIATAARTTLDREGFDPTSVLEQTEQLYREVLIEPRLER